MVTEMMVSQEQIVEFQNTYGYTLPGQYQDFLKQHDGYLFDSGVRLYELDDLKEMNESLQVRDYQPEYMAIGDDSGGLVFLTKQEKDAKEVFIVDICDYDLETAYCKINDFKSWFDKGCIIPQERGEENGPKGKNGDLYMIKPPSGGIKDLAKIKKIFAMDIATSELLKLSKELPCRIASNITYAKASKLMQEFGQVDIFEYYDKG